MTIPASPITSTPRTAMVYLTQAAALCTGPATTTTGAAEAVPLEPGGVTATPPKVSITGFSEVRASDGCARCEMLSSPDGSLMARSASLPGGGGSGTGPVSNGFGSSPLTAASAATNGEISGA